MPVDTTRFPHGCETIREPSPSLSDFHKALESLHYYFLNVNDVFLSNKWTLVNLLTVLQQEFKQELGIK